jgi:ribonucleoside-diphosphate reductase alpha chain
LSIQHKQFKNDDNFTLQWPVDVPVEKAKITKIVKAKDMWDQIIDAAWTSAEPGLLFWDNVKKQTPADAYESKGYGSISTNPCAELVLSAFDSCRLLVLDLSKFIDEPFSHNATFNFDKFNNFSIKAQRLMDDLVDLEIEAVDKIIEKIKTDPEPDDVKLIELNLWNSIKSAASGARRTGLGITALGDALAMLNIKYGSDASIEMTEKILQNTNLYSKRDHPK